MSDEYRYSHAYNKWSKERSKPLNHLEDLRDTLTDGSVGRKWNTEEMNHALLLKLCAEFQGFCIDLFREASEAFVDKRLQETDPDTQDLFLFYHCKFKQDDERKSSMECS